MNPQLAEELQKIIKGEVKTDSETLNHYSHDASIFELKPKVVVCPKDSEDVKNLIKFINQNKNNYPELSVTPRSAGTDMSGGVLTESISISFTQHINQIKDMTQDQAKVEPGMYYRDFEKVTSEKGIMFPAYPASRGICAIGGMVGNNCGGEKSLSYGKAVKYVTGVKAILGDGEEYEFSELGQEELNKKLAQNDFEGEIYKKIYKLINDNYDLVEGAKPNVLKNSSGYNLWDVYNKQANTFNLAKLFTGSQGTLGIITEATLMLVPIKKCVRLATVYLYQKDIQNLGLIINEVLATNPESFETYDDKTLRLAIKYFASFTEKIGSKNILQTAINFLPEFKLLLQNRIPKLVIMMEYSEHSEAELDSKIALLKNNLKKHSLKINVIHDNLSFQKYWAIRRESFKLLKEKIKNMYASPFIDDIVVNPEYLPEFLPQLNKIIEKYPSIISTTAGHIGEGDFHIIPLVDLKKQSERDVILNLSHEVFDLVLKYKGSTSGEHNDGIIRTPFIKQMFGERVSGLFLETKKIFDPNNIFNPGKKTDIDFDYVKSHIRSSW